MSVGYSADLIKRNKEADSKLTGVKLGRFCIKNNHSVSYVARMLNVSRQTVYNWFTGKSSPLYALPELTKWL